MPAFITEMVARGFWWAIFADVIVSGFFGVLGLVLGKINKMFGCILQYLPGTLFIFYIWHIREHTGWLVCAIIGTIFLPFLIIQGNRNDPASARESKENFNIASKYAAQQNLDKTTIGSCTCSSFNDVDISKLNIYPKPEWQKKRHYLIIGKYNDCVIKYANQKTKFRYAEASDRDLVDKNVSMGYPEPIRFPCEDEGFSNIEEIMKQNQDLSDLAARFTISLFDLFLVISMRKTYVELKKVFPDTIPDAKFCLMEKKLFDRPRIAVVQKWIDGLSLWDLFYHKKNIFEMKKKIIAESIKKYLDSELIDLNIQNFILTPDDKLYYVDCKPTYTNTKRVNEINRNGILEYIF
jgi:hypothetical protein